MEEKDINLEQFVEKIVDYSSKYNSLMHTSYSPQNLVGKYSKYPKFGDFPETYTLRSYGKWWKNTEAYQKCYMLQDVDPLGTEDYVTVQFATAVIPSSIYIYETYNPGSVVRILGKQLEHAQWHLLWEGPPQICVSETRKFRPEIFKVNCYINIICLELNCSHLKHHPCFDAILLCGQPANSKLQEKLYGMLKTQFQYITKSQKLSEVKCDNNFSTNNVDLFSNLPYEVIIHIFQYLDLKSLSRCALVNKMWNRATHDPILYRNLSLKRYWCTVNCDTLRYFSGRSRNIRKLDVSWCGNQDISLFSKVFCDFLKSCCGNLTHLSMGNCFFVNNEIIERISQIPEIIDLRLRNVSCVTIFEPLRNLKKLVALDLYSTDICTEELIPILQANINLKHLNIDFCENLQDLDRVVSVIAEYNTQLMSWSSWKTNSMTSVGVALFSFCPRLEELDLGWCLVLAQPADCLNKIAVECSNLKRLIISGWRGVTDDALMPIVYHCRKLVHLDFLGIKSISKGLIDSALMSLPHLQLLEISFCDSIPRETVSVWRNMYPSVTIQRSCEFETADFWN